MSHIPFHPAIGFGDLLPGSYAVPQNPIRDVGTPMVPSRRMITGGQVATMGDLLPGRFVVPQNPLVNTMLYGHNLGSGAPPQTGMSGLGCGCQSCGMGDLPASLQTLDNNLAAWLNDTTLDFTGLGIPNYGYIAGGAALVMAWVLFMPSGSEYRRKRSQLRSQYRGYRRVAKSAGSSLSAV
jgi:hypothetical protein